MLAEDAHARLVIVEVPPAKHKNAWRDRFVKFLIFAIVVTAITLILTQKYHILILNYLHNLQKDANTATVCAIISIYALTFIVISLVGIPMSLMSFAAGMLFRPFGYALAVVALSIWLSATVGFYVGRHLVRRVIFGRGSLVDGIIDTTSHHGSTFYRSEWFKRRRKTRIMLYALKLRQQTEDLSADTTLVETDEDDEVTESDALISRQPQGHSLTRLLHKFGFKWHVMKVALLFRFIQVVPFAITTYALAVMMPAHGPNALQLLPFQLTSLLGVLPGLSVFVLAGSLVNDYNIGESDGGSGGLERSLGRKGYLTMLIVSTSVLFTAFVTLICWGRKMWRGMVVQVEYAVRCKRLALTQAASHAGYNDQVLQRDEDDLSFVGDDDYADVNDLEQKRPQRYMRFWRRQPQQQAKILATHVRVGSDDSAQGQEVLVKPVVQLRKPTVHETNGQLTRVERYMIYALCIGTLLANSIMLPLIYTGTALV